MVDVYGPAYTQPVAKRWPKIFISYAREDVESARRLRRDLVHLGVDVWFDEDSLLPGQRWQSVIARAIRGSDFVVVLLSPSSVTKRGYVQKEARLAIEVLDEHPESRIFLIPARLALCEPEHERIRELNWVDMFPSWEAGLSRIAQALVRSGFDLLLRPKPWGHGGPRARTAIDWSVGPDRDRSVPVLEPGADPLQQIIGPRHPLRRQLPRSRITEQTLLLQPDTYALVVLTRRPKQRVVAEAQAAALGRRRWSRNAFRIFVAENVPDAFRGESETYSTFPFEIDDA